MNVVFEYKESFCSFHTLAVNAFRTFNAWDIWFTSKFFWFVLPNAKASITSPRLRRPYDAWSEEKSNFLGTKSLLSIQRLWNTTQAKPYNLRVSLLISHLQKRTLNLIFNLPNAPSVTGLARLLLQLKYRLSSGSIASPWGFNINVQSGKVPSRKIKAGILISSTS